MYRGQDGKKRIIAQRLEGSLDSAAAQQPSSFTHPAAPAPAQTYTITADGKRRITPMAVGGSGVVQVTGNAGAGSSGRAMTMTAATGSGGGGSVNPIFQPGAVAAGAMPPPLPSYASQWSNPPQSYTQYAAAHPGGGGHHTLAVPAAQYHYQYAPVALHPTDGSQAAVQCPLMAPQPGAKVVATVLRTPGAAAAAAGGAGGSLTLTLTLTLALTLTLTQAR